MGMFDFVQCKYPLPVEGLEGALFHTKSMSCFMDTYEIREDGSLWGQDYDIEDLSDPNAEGAARLFGMLSRTNIRPRFCADFSGVIDFYTEGKDRTWLDFRARFSNGMLQSLEKAE